jgi:hypothetical protein
VYKRLNIALALVITLASFGTNPVSAANAAKQQRNINENSQAPTQAAVMVQFANQQTTFSARPRLATVLAATQPGPNAYWPAARLYQLNHPAAELQRQLVLQLINSISAASPQQLTRLQQLATQISNWQLAKPLYINIDYDRARLIPSANPRFDYGQYLLQYGTRPSRFLVMGATAGDIWLQLKDAMPASQYLPGLNLSELANRDQISIIQPNGQVITTGVGYWNYQYQEIMPGSILFIPFRPNAFANAAELNQQLIELAKYRVQP